MCCSNELLITAVGLFLLGHLLHLLGWLLSHGDLVLGLLPHNEDGGHPLLGGGGGDGLLLVPDCFGVGGQLLHADGVAGGDCLHAGLGGG